MTNRQQSVSIDGELSQHKTVTYDVPQGTILYPILFPNYLNNS